MTTLLKLDSIDQRTRQRVRSVNHLPLAEQAERMGLTLWQITRLRATLIQAGHLEPRRATVAADTPDRIRRLLGQGLRLVDAATALGIPYSRAQRIVAAHKISVESSVERWDAYGLRSLLCVSKDTVRLWIERGWLQTSDYADDRNVARRHRTITRRDLQQFMHERDAWPTYEPHLAQDDNLRELGMSLRRYAGGRWLSRKELALLAGITSESVSKRVGFGWLADWRWTRHNRAMYVWLPDGRELPPWSEAIRRQVEAERQSVAAD